MSEHTPGPWEATRSAANRKRWSIFGNEWNGSERNRYKTSVAETSNWLSTDPPEEVEANARLIAAAPELLEALMGLMRRVDIKTYTAGSIGDDLDAARQAITRATEPNS